MLILNMSRNSTTKNGHFKKCSATKFILVFGISARLNLMSIVRSKISYLHFYQRNCIKYTPLVHGSYKYKNKLKSFNKATSFIKIVQLYPCFLKLHMRMEFEW